MIPDYSSPQNDSSTVSLSDSTVPSRLLAESSLIAREIREGTLSAFVGAGTKIAAEVSFKSLLRIDGLLSGRITSDEGTLVVAAAGRVEANVRVAIARINGSVTGDIVCSERIELGPTAKVTGNIKAPTLSIDTGAVLDGRCRMTTTVPELEITEPATAASETVAQVKAIAEPEVAAQELAVSEQPIADPAEANTVKPRKIARKANVLKAKPRRARAKTATANTTDREPANEEQAAAAAG